MLTPFPQALREVHAAVFAVVWLASSRASPLLQGGVSALDYRTPDATKPALGGFCLASYLVGRGNLNQLNNLLIYNIKDNFNF
ncbi:hypothetical protein [Pseudomonas sp. IT-P218]|uniref:hypothetical protein n=1 Tax=Pseudomonas sp. IT-P218 TaxID=3026449 RepID=UPI0039DFD9AE